MKNGCQKKSFFLKAFNTFLEISLISGGKGGGIFKENSHPCVVQNIMIILQVFMLKHAQHILKAHEKKPQPNINLISPQSGRGGAFGYWLLCFYA